MVFASIKDMVIKAHVNMSAASVSHPTPIFHATNMESIAVKISINGYWIDIFVLHDELGNFRGSEVIKFKSKNKAKEPTTKKKIIRKRIKIPRRRMQEFETKEALDTAFFENGNIKHKDWLEARKKITEFE